MSETRVELARVGGLAAQLVDPLCEEIDGCVGVEAGVDRYWLLFEEGTESLEAWQRVHEVLQRIDPQAERFALAEYSAPPLATQVAGAPATMIPASVRPAAPPA